MSLTKTRFEPTEVASDTFLIHDHHGEGQAPVSARCLAVAPALGRRRGGDRRRRPPADRGPSARLRLPTTRGLFDPTTGVYWAADGFASPMLTPVRDVEELDADFWLEGMAMFNQYVSPWITLTDDAKFQATVDRVEALGASRLVGCHTPVIGRSHIDWAMTATRRSPYATVAPEPDQAVLDQIQLSLIGG
jgi:hypothetical protein